MSLNGIVSSGHHLASIAGIKILEDGGNAFDAAIATSSSLCVLTPHACGVGGDAFVLIYDASRSEVTALNASGPAPKTADRNFFTRQGLSAVPDRGLKTASVPGIVDCWSTITAKYCTMGSKELFRRAILYAEEGFPVYNRLAGAISESMGKLQANGDSRETYLKGGKDAPSPGEILVQKNLARTLQKISINGSEEFYRGSIAARIDKFCKENDGWITKRDLEEYSCEVLEPLKSTYRGYTVFEQPPVSQGFIVLEMLNILEGFNLRSMQHNHAEAIHTMVEAKKIAFRDRLQYLTDPKFGTVPIGRLISKKYANELKKRISSSELSETIFGLQAIDRGTDTTYFTVIDKEGNAVSFIQSVFFLFGSGVTIGELGITLNNRMTAFSLGSDDVNRLEPGKKTAHTLNSYILTTKGRRDGDLFLAGGTPGADDQVQVNTQIIADIIDYDMALQEAIEAPRWASRPGTYAQEMVDELRIENRIDKQVMSQLRKLGHKVKVVGGWAIGGAQAIMVKNQVRYGAADPRRDGYAIAQ